jgi:toxin ParE1/3/4
LPCRYGTSGEFKRGTATARRGRVVPELRAEGLEMYRELAVSKYRVLFRVRDREVVLLEVLDGRRDLAELLVQRAIGDVL